MRNIVKTVHYMCGVHPKAPSGYLKSCIVLNSVLGFPIYIYTCAEAYKLPKSLTATFYTA